MEDSPANGPTSLSEVLLRHRVVVCVGSGGVGKTTTAAALALQAALRGRRVLCLTIDPARRLANSLGLAGMTAEEQTVPADMFAQYGLAPTGALSAMMLDTKRTFDGLVAQYASRPEIRDRILNNRLYQYMSTALAGTSEYMAMEKLHSVRQSDRFDLIVLDTPPASNALDFLAAPERMVALVDSPAMRWFTQAMDRSGLFSVDLLGKSAGLLFRGIGRFTGGEFLTQLAEFVTDFNDLFGGFRKRSREVAAALRSPDVAFVLVTRPSHDAMSEALNLKAHLSDAAMGVEAIVINGVRPTFTPPPDHQAALWKSLEEHAGSHHIEATSTELRRLTSQLQQALSDNNASSAADHAQVTWFQRQTPNYTAIRVPAFPTDVHDLGMLAELAKHLVDH